MKALSAMSAAAMLVATASAPGAAGARALVETPSLQALVKSGKLPAIEERLPKTPLVVDLGKRPETSLGRHGGEMRMLMGKPKDVRMLVVYGYARLVAYDQNLTIRPDILERVEVEDGRRFTLYLRKGHKWSDGHPFTAADFKYYWEDVATNEDVSPFGLSKALLVDGKRPDFEVIDETTVRYAWPTPNPQFLPALAGARPLFIYRPAHYLKQFHGRYMDAEKLKGLVENAGKRNWAGLHHSKDRQYRADNIDLPTLQPWKNTTRPPSEQFIFARNPYFHRIDTAGRQLPYIDRVVFEMGDTKIIPVKTGAGAAHLQARYIKFDNYSFLKESEKRHDFTVRLWRTVKGAQIALFPNLNAADPVWRKVLRDVRFRRALSLAIDREEINQVVYLGLAIPSNNTVLEASPLFKPEYRDAWTEFDLKRANALLDAVGLDKRNDEGLRLLPDGRVADIIVETSGESTEETDVLELVRDSLKKIGIKLFPKPAQREVFRRRIFAGKTIMSVWSGITNGVATADVSPRELAPTTQQQYHWPKWGQYADTGGRAGEAPDMPLVKELVRLNDAWFRSSDPAERLRIWHRMLKIHSDQVFTIGIVNGTMQPVVVSNRLRNVPEEGIYNWDPGAYFGIYRPDTFWFAKK